LIYILSTPLAAGMPSFITPANSEDLKKYGDQWLALFGIRIYMG